MIYEQNFDGVDQQNFDEAVKWYRQSLNGGLEEPEKLDIDDLPLAKIVFEIHSVLENLRIKDANNISLTHFTSFEVFKKVIQKGTVKTLRLNDIDSCNDPKEGKTLFEFLKHDEFKKYVDKSNNEKDSYPLVLSFCDGNPENLPMWNQYADHSKGVGLSLTKKSIKKLVSSGTMYRDNSKVAVSNPIEDSNKDLKSSAKDSSVESNKNSDNPQKNIFPTLYRVMYLPRNKEITEIDEGDLKIEYQQAFKNLQQAFKNSQQKFKKI